MMTLAHAKVWKSLVAAGGGLLLASATLAGEVSLSIRHEQTAPDGTVQLLVSVVDGNGAPIVGLTSANFSAQFDGGPSLQASVAPASESGEGVAVVLAIDVSGSMVGAAIDGARRAASSFVDQLTAADVCSLMTFGTGVTQVSGFTGDRERLKQELAGLQAKQQFTYLHQALYDAAVQASTAPRRSCAVVILTDGKDEGSPVSIEDAVLNAQRRQVPIYPLGFGPAVIEEPLRRIAKLSGGNYLHAPSIDELESVYSQVLQQLKRQYLLTVPTRSVAAGEHVLTVEVTYRGSTIRREKRVQIPQPGSTEEGAERAGKPQPESRRDRGWLLFVVGAVVIAAIAAPVITVLVVKKRRSKEVICACCGVEPALPGQRYGSDCLRRSTSEEPVRQTQVWLDVVAGPMTGERAFLGVSPLTVGREAGNDLALVEDGQISSRHAEISLDSEGRYVLLDRQSANHTYINGNEAQRVTLRDGDRIRIGQTELVFSDHRGPGKLA